ncbi:MAG: response regulator transcription factor [Pseudomonadota bacterium]
MTMALRTPAQKQHILLVDDDELFRESIERNLVNAGFDVTSFSSGRRFLDALEGLGGDLLLLDWRMPDLNGIEVLKQLREQHVDIPVIFLTVLSDQIYEEAALLGGAVDFIEKSRSFSIVERRISLILSGARTRDSANKQSGPQHIGPLEIDHDASRAYWRNRTVDLTLTEFRIVRYLAGRAGQDSGYRQIYDQVHGEGFAAGDGEIGYRANVRTLIKRIRQKFKAIDPSFEQISNYPGFGYRWDENETVGRAER